MMEQANIDASPLSMQEWNQKVGLRHLARIKELFKKDPDEEFERRLESLSRGKTKGIIYYAAGIKKDSMIENSENWNITKEKQYGKRL